MLNDLSTIINMAIGLVGLGSVYGLIRADLKHMHEKIEVQYSTNRDIFQKLDALDARINNHIDHHHFRTGP